MYSLSLIHIYVKRSIQQVTQFVIQLLPFIVRQLATLDFLTRNLAHVGYQTVHQLHVTHFKREQCYGIAEIHGNVFCHGKYERRFTHGRTGCNNDEVGLLPSGKRCIIDRLLDDQSGKEMLKVTRLSAKFDILPLFSGKISISNIQLFGFNINLNKDVYKRQVMMGIAQ